MATATRRTPETLTVHLREEFVRGTAPHKVDWEKGIIFDVKVIGLTSPNTHGVKGVDGTVYSPESRSRASRDMEGIGVNKNHPPRDKPHQDRTVQERVGWLEGVSPHPDGNRGNLHLLLKDPDSLKIMEAAEKRPQLFALSINGFGRGRVEAGKYVVSEIVNLRSVDVVTDGGTTASLFEGRENPIVKKKIRQIWESVKDAQVKGRLLSLLELDDMAGVGDYEAEPPAEEESYELHLGRLIAAILTDKTLDTKAKQKKVLAATKLLDAGEEAPAEEEEVEESEDDEEEDKPKETKESKKAKKPKDPTLKQLKERLDLADLREWVRGELDARKLAADKPLLESLEAIRDKKKITAHLDYLKGQLARLPARPGPRSRPPGGVPVQESRNGGAGAQNGIPQDVGGRMQFLRG